MLNKIREFLANNPKVAAIATAILEIEKFVATGAVVTYAGKPIYNKQGELETGFKAALARGGKIALAIGTLGGTLVYDLVMDPTVTQTTVNHAVETGFVQQHEDLVNETKKALAVFNELSAQMQEVVMNAKAVIEARQHQLTAEPKKS